MREAWVSAGVNTGRWLHRPISGTKLTARLGQTGDMCTLPAAGVVWESRIGIASSGRVGVMIVARTSTGRTARALLSDVRALCAGRWALSLAAALSRLSGQMRREERS